MSEMYDAYLQIHKAGVCKAYQWIEENIPQVLKDLDKDIDWQIQFNHDASKTDAEEYQAYDAYFYGDRSYKVVQDFKYAWLHHIHNNPHHWQYWVLINDDEEEGTIALEMPFEYVIEMICDWWSFSFRSGDLREVFSWYADHEKRMILHKKTRELVDYILAEINNKLDEMDMKLDDMIEEVNKEIEREESENNTKEE